MQLAASVCSTYHFRVSAAQQPSISWVRSHGDMSNVLIVPSNSQSTRLVVGAPVISAFDNGQSDNISMRPQANRRCQAMQDIGRTRQRNRPADRDLLMLLWRESSGTRCTIQGDRAIEPAQIHEDRPWPQPGA